MKGKKLLDTKVQEASEEPPVITLLCSDASSVISDTPIVSPTKSQLSSNTLKKIQR